MKVAVYIGLFILFTMIVYQLNSLFNVNEGLANKFGTQDSRDALSNKKRLKELSEISGKVRASVDAASSDAKEKLETSITRSEREEVVKFSKRYFGQAGRNYRVFYMKDERMVYLHRMWFDQIRSPASMIKSDFPSIFEQSGCCFVGEPDFFIVIPGTNIYKEIGPYKFDR